MAKLISDTVMKTIFSDTTLTNTDIDLLNEAITSRIEEYCKTSIGKKSVRVYFDSVQTIKPEFLPISKVVHLIDGDRGKPLDDSELPNFPTEGWETELEYVSTPMIEGTDYYVYKTHVSIPSPSGKLKGVVLDYEYGVSIEDIPTSVHTVAEDLARYEHFKLTEGALLFYDKQTFEERTYEFSGKSEKRILAGLAPFIRSISGRGRLRIGVI